MCPPESAKEAQSFEQAFESEFARLHRYVNRSVGRDAADEITAQTFATAYASWERYDQQRQVRPWLYGIASNLTRHYWRGEERRLRAYAKAADDEPSVDETQNIVTRLDARAKYSALAKLLTKLNPKDRDILLLHAWADLTDPEIAISLSIPVGTVKSRLSKTRARLRRELADAAPDDARAAQTKGDPQ